MTPISTDSSNRTMVSQGTPGSTRTGPSSGEFLALLTAQLTQQDPLEPMKNEEMMNQIVSMQTMDGLENLRVSIESLTRQRSVRAVELLGTEVELDEKGFKTVGTVDSVRFVNDQAELVVNGKTYPESAIVSVRQS